MILRNYVFRDGGNIPPRYTCDGANVNPILVIESIPEEAKSLVLIVDDPDATGGFIFTHWFLWNISPATTEIREGEAPEGAVQGKNDFGNEGYGGPCPPKGARPHRYMFKLYALDTLLDIPRSSGKEKLENAMEGHIVARTTMMGLYARVI